MKSITWINGFCSSSFIVLLIRLYRLFMLIVCAGRSGDCRKQLRLLKNPIPTYRLLLFSLSLSFFRQPVDSGQNNISTNATTSYTQINHNVHNNILSVGIYFVSLYHNKRIKNVGKIIIKKNCCVLDYVIYLFTGILDIYIENSLA